MGEEQERGLGRTENGQRDISGERHWGGGWGGEGRGQRELHSWRVTGGRRSCVPWWWAPKQALLHASELVARKLNSSKFGSYVEEWNQNARVKFQFAFRTGFALIFFFHLTNHFTTGEQLLVRLHWSCLNAFEATTLGFGSSS